MATATSTKQRLGNFFIPIQSLIFLNKQYRDNIDTTTYRNLVGFSYLISRFGKHQVGKVYFIHQGGVFSNPGSAHARCRASGASVY
jgi:hypothetical protein